MKKVKSLVIAILLITSVSSHAQEKWFTRNGTINIFSKTSAENIDADNHEVFSMIDEQKNELAFQVLNTGFEFKKQLMQEHFNEDYMESSKFPKASFKGVITEPSKVNFNKEGTYNVVVAGDLTMHGVTNKVSIPATIRIEDKKITGESKFNVQLADYGIKIPAVVANQVSETVAINVNCQYEPYAR